MSSRRILISGLSSHWGGRVAQLLERDPSIETIIGIDREDPRHELQRTEFVRVETDDLLVRRIVVAAAIDTVLDTRLIIDPLSTSVEQAHEVNVTGTRNLIAACSGADSPVRKFVFKSSAMYYGCDHGDPAFFSEEMPRSHPPRTALERDVVEAESALSELAAARPEVVVTVLRFTEVIGDGPRGSQVALMSLPVVPSILGFDPRCQFIHDDDVIGVLAHAASHQLAGTYNAAGDGVLALSEVASLLGKPMLPVLPPWGTVFAAMQLRRLGLRIPVETLRQLRFGRGLDNRRLKASGYRFSYTSREAVLKLRAHQRLRPLLRSGADSYRYDREVEDFLRWSPSVNAVRGVAARTADGTSDSSAAGALEDLGEGELIELISSLDAEALRQLRSHEASGQRRPRVLAALDRNLARHGGSGRR